MSANEWRPSVRSEWLLAAALIVAGMTIMALAVAEISASNPPPQLAQATQPTPSSPAEAGKKDVPAEAKPGGTRPTTPAPEPARPDVEAQKTGAQPALPQAPAEKVAPPIREK